MESRLGLVEQEQLAAQVVAVMDACFKRPTAEEKSRILYLAGEQINAASTLSSQSAVTGGAIND
jgi:hypothetical protein